MVSRPPIVPELSRSLNAEMSGTMNNIMAEQSAEQDRVSNTGKRLLWNTKAIICYRRVLNFPMADDLWLYSKVG